MSEKRRFLIALPFILLMIGSAFGLAVVVWDFSVGQVADRSAVYWGSFWLCMLVLGVSQSLSIDKRLAGIRRRQGFEVRVNDESK